MQLSRTPAAFSLVALLALGVSSGVPCRAYSDDAPSRSAVSRAKKFFDCADNARYVLGFVHMGASYDGSTYAGVRPVVRNGETVSGQFAVVYDYAWQSDGKTRIAFLCNEQGDVYRVQILYTNATLQHPFAVAKLSIDVLGTAILEAFKNKMNETDRAQLQTLIKDSDPQAILELGLKLRQAFGQ
jgi:hypothetical protein